MPAGGGGGGLAVTGSDLVPRLAVAVILFIVGISASLAGRRRRRSAAI
jgi:hypothetical protein